MHTDTRPSYAARVRAQSGASVQAFWLPRSRSDMLSVSINRASRANTPKTDNTTTVAIPVPTGKCQNSHNIVAEESTTIAIKPQILVRACADVVMPAPRINANQPTYALYL